MRFFFHLHNSIGLTKDQEGRELDDITQARNEAIIGVRSVIAAEVIEEGRIDLRGKLEIADASGKILDVVQFIEVVNISTPDVIEVAMSMRAGRHSS
jgi:hypothetical protein